VYAYLNLDNSLLFDVFRVSEIPGFVDLLEYTLDLIGLKNTGTKSYYHKRDFARNFLANIYVSERLNRPIAISRNKNDWVMMKRYHQLYLSYRAMDDIFNRFRKANLIMVYDGFKYPTYNLMTRFHAEDKLLKIFERFVPIIESIPVYEDKDFLILHKSKRLADYEDTERTIRMRTELENYNNYISEHDFSIEVNNLSLNLSTLLWEYRMKGLLTFNMSNIMVIPQYYNITHNHHTHTITKYKLINIESNQPVDYLKICMGRVKSSRIFNENFLNGGRFYKSVVQLFGKEDRKGIQINGSPVTELDYSSLHPRMCYNLKGLEYNGDCYDAISESPEERAYMKIIVLSAINCRKSQLKNFGNTVNWEIHKRNKKVLASSNPRKENLLNGLTFETVTKYLERAKKYHSPIADCMFSRNGKGIKLQYLDSTIMNGILQDCLHEGIPALPVHDSLVASAKHKDFVHTSMVENYQKVMNGYTPIIK
jgi:hypothetical protein